MIIKSAPNIIKILAGFVLTIALNSCLKGGHGSIKSYEYHTGKYALQKAVEEVIRGNPNIMRETTKNYIIDKTNNRNDTILDNYYNDGETYLSLIIREENGDNNYIIRYGGDKVYWDTASQSSLSIAYAYDKDANGGSEGNGGVNSKLKHKLTGLFERQLISKVDIELKQKHHDTVPD